MGVLFTQIEVAGCCPSCCPSWNRPEIDLFIFDPGHGEQLRGGERLAARFKHERRHPQLFSKLERVARPPGRFHERLKRHEPRRRYTIHLALAGGATGPPLARFDMHELMRKRATPLHLKQTLIQPDKVAAVRFTAPPLKARELHTHARERGVQMIPRVIKTHPPTMTGG